MSREHRAVFDQGHEGEELLVVRRPPQGNGEIGVRDQNHPQRIRLGHGELDGPQKLEREDKQWTS